MRSNNCISTINVSLHYTIIALLILIPYLFTAIPYYLIYVADNLYFRNYFLITSVFYFIVYFISVGIYAYEFNDYINKLQLKLCNSTINVNIVRKIAIKYLYSKAISDILFIILLLMYLFIIMPGILMLLRGYILNLLIMGIYIIYFIIASFMMQIYYGQMELLSKKS